ncbi:hypothetical protein [Rhizobium sp. WYJ-E13]|uniref:hypothetical protein n=1 Tax=Rhizobium sp. WYJ-E13 TaxID=2849093 RepID=UPI001C1E982A|nr:hypothetical protein [Rhizobium sp. WYJ-E13]QWW71221.1 hypothetical protein KQ933_31200 [Rhizobium sp. WYJ-E13]
MADRFPVSEPLEIGFVRRVLLAAEIVDGVTLRPVTSGIRVSASGLRQRPRINASGFYVWLEEGDRQAGDIVVEALHSGFESTQAAPTALPGHVRIELTPTPRYRFTTGATALRATLRESLFGPSVPVANARIRLQWSDDNGWNDARLVSISAANGDFAVALRLAAADEARSLPNGDLAVRLKVERDGVVRTSDEIPLRQGAVSAWRQAFIWDELLP